MHTQTPPPHDLPQPPGLFTTMHFSAAATLLRPVLVHLKLATSYSLSPKVCTNSVQKFQLVRYLQTNLVIPIVFILCLIFKEI